MYIRSIADIPLKWKDMRNADILKLYEIARISRENNKRLWTRPECGVSKKAFVVLLSILEANVKD